MGGGGFLGLGPAPSAPAAPDYSGAAQATAAGNVDAARIATKANRVNQVTPYGSLTYTQNTAPTFNQAGYNAALQSYNQARESYNPVYSQETYDEYGNYSPRSLLNPFDLKAPTYNEFMVAADPDAGWTATQTLSPDQQKLLDYQNQASIGLGRLANTGLGYVEGMLSTPFDTSRLAQMQSSVSPADMQRISGQANLGQVGQAEQLQRVGGGPQALQAGQAQQAFGVNPAEQSLRVGNAQQAQGIGSGEMAQRVGGGPQFQGLETARALRQSGQTEGLQRSLGQNVGMAGWDRASDLLMSRLTPQIEQSQDRLRAQLANQGIVAGTEAYDRAMTQQGQRENDLRTQAQLQAQGIQQNLFGQELQAGQFGNQATTQQQQNLLQNLGFSNQAQQQDYANRQAQLAFNNQLGQQGYQNQLAGVQANNQAIAQNFGQNLSAQQLQNQAAQQNYSNLLSGAGFNQNAIQQNFGNQVTAQQLANQAGQQNYANQLAGLGFNAQQNQQGYQNQLAQQQANNQVSQQNFANQLAGMGFNNQQIQQMYQNQTSQQQANNAIAQQQFANQMAGANLSNQARQQGLQEQAYLRNEPLNTLSAVRTGSQVQGPQFVNSFNQATTQGADLLGAAGMQYNAQMGDFNAQQAAQQNFNSGLMGLGGAGIMAFSDIRMKENIKHIHWLPNGLPVYTYEYKPEFKEIAGHGVHIGVMAQEVEMVKPEAVITNAEGYKMVNYGLLL